MRVLLITYEYPPVGGGTGKAARNTALQLAAAGHEPIVLTSAFGDLPREEFERLPESFSRDGDPGSPRGVEVVRIPVLRRHLNRANALEVLSFAASALWRFRKIRSLQADVSTAWLTIPCGIVAEALRLSDRVPYVCLLRGQDVPGYPEMKPVLHALAWPVTRWIWSRAGRVVANSQGLADLARRSAPRLDVAVIRNGVDTEIYAPPARDPDAVVPFESALGEHDRAPDFSVRRRSVLYVGRLVRKKRVRELVRAFALVSKKEVVRPSFPARVVGGLNCGKIDLREDEEAEPDLELRIAGHGPERPHLEALARELGVEDRVRFLGRLDEAEVVKALREADLFVNPSEGEGLPNAVLEAMATGLPVVLSDIPPHRELIAGTEAGALAGAGSPGDAETFVNELARQIARYVTGSHCGVGLFFAGRRARARAEEFGWAAATGRLVEMMEDAIRNSAPPGGRDSGAGRDARPARPPD